MRSINTILDDESLGDLAIEYVRGYVRTLDILLTGGRYDAILAPGNSGAIMAKFCQVYSELAGQKLPVVLNIPIGRQNGEMLPIAPAALEVRRRIKLGDRVERVLFVDDEIGTGATLKASINALLQTSTSIKRLDCFVVAENRGSLSDFEALRYRVYFRPYVSQHYPHSWNIILNHLRTPRIDEIRSSLIYGPAAGRALNVALGVPVKVICEQDVCFTDEYSRVVEILLPDLAEIRAETVTWLKAIFQSALDRP